MTREEAIYEIKQLAVLSTDKEIPKITEALNMAIEALQREDRFLKSMETNEPLYTEVVRCKDCRYFKKIVERSDSGLCHRDLVASAWKENDYCSRGERKGGDDE